MQGLFNTKVPCVEHQGSDMLFQVGVNCDTVTHPVTRATAA